MKIKPNIIMYYSDTLQGGGIDPHDVYEADIVIELNKEKGEFSLLKHRQIGLSQYKNIPVRRIHEVLNIGD